MATTVNKPAVTLNIIGEQSEVANTEQKILVFGQKLGGTATAGVLVADVQLGDLDSVFGNYSTIADMVRNIRKYNTVNSIDVMPFADGTLQAEATIEVTSVAGVTAATTFYISVGSQTDHRTSVDVSVGDTVTTVAASIVAAINAMNTGASLCPFTASNMLGVVTITCEQAGVIGNSMSAKLEVPANSGITFDLTAFSGGTDSLDLDAYFSSIVSRYQTVVWPFSNNSTNLKEVSDWLETRINADRKVLDGQAFASTIVTTDDLTTVINSRTLTVLASKLVANPDSDLAIGADICEKEYAKAAQVAAINALRLTDDASLTRFQTTVAPADQFGGMGISTLPYFNTLLPLMPKSNSYGYTETEQDTLTDKGYSFIGNVPNGSSVVIGDLRTTYGFDSGGNPDDSWVSLNNVVAMSAAREYFYNNLRKRFAQSRLTGGKTVAGRSVADQDIIEAYCSALNLDLGEVAVTEVGNTTVDGVLIDAGDFFNDNLTVTLDTGAGSVTINAVLLVVGQLRTILGTLQLAFSNN